MNENCKKNKKYTVVADDKIPFLADSPLKELVNLILLPGAEIGKNDLLTADALITRTRTKCNRELLEGTPVRFIATATIGYDHIDTKYCEEKGITWVNAPGCNAESVAQYVASALVTLSENHEFDLGNETLGIIGVGHVGKCVERMAEQFGMKVLLNDPPRANNEENTGFVSLDELLTQSDIVTLHVPLEKSGKYPTFHLADSAFFAKMKKGSLFINASRGPVTDSEALKTVLKSNRMAGAVLDVWEYEPEIDRELLKLVELGTPHIAGYSTDGKGNGTAMSVHALLKFFGIKGYENWYPELPEPECNKRMVNSISEAIRVSYDIRKDASALCTNPELFEKLRGRYPLRREFPAFQFLTKDDKLSKQLNGFGFHSKQF